MRERILRRPRAAALFLAAALLCVALMFAAPATALAMESQSSDGGLAVETPVTLSTMPGGDQRTDVVPVSGGSAGTTLGKTGDSAIPFSILAVGLVGSGCVVMAYSIARFAYDRRMNERGEHESSR